MENPWANLNKKPPFLLSSDAGVINAFNQQNRDRQEYFCQTHIIPEPFIGNPEATVYVLGLNPGYDLNDDIWHSRKDFSSTLFNNLIHKQQKYPHYHFNPKYAESPGAHWWRSKSRWLIDLFGLEEVSESLFCVELFPYHSRSYKPIPKRLLSEEVIPSVRYSIYLLKRALEDGKAVVAMRAFKPWCELVPELEKHTHLFRLNSPQNVAMSPNNINDFDSLCAFIK